MDFRGFQEYRREVYCLIFLLDGNFFLRINYSLSENVLDE
jgi:hypothetical protein